MRPLEKAARRGVADDRAPIECDHAIRRAQAAFEAVLGEQDRRPPLLVEPAQQREQLVAGDRVELRGRLVEREQPRAPGECGAERDTLELAAREIDRRALEQRLDAERERDLLDPAGRRDGAVPAILERERQLRADRAHHDLGLGILEQRADLAGERRRAVLAQIHAADLGAAVEVPAVEVRHEAGRDAEQRRLARRGAAGEHDELALGDLERQLAQRGRRRPRVGVGDPLELERVHATIPRRCANGARAASASAPASTKVEAPNDPWIAG